MKGFIFGATCTTHAVDRFTVTVPFLLTAYLRLTYGETYGLLTAYLRAGVE